MIRRLLPALLAASVGGAVYADTVTSIAVPLDRNLESETSFISYMLREVLRQSSRVEYIDLAEAAQGPEARTRVKDGKKARKTFKNAMFDYRNLEFDPALEGFEDAIRHFEVTDLTQTMDGLLASRAMLAATLFFNGDVRSARAQLEILLSLKPDYEFDEEVLTPEILAVAEEVRTRVRENSTLTLEVQVSPVPARVYVNGVFRGLSPQSLTRIAPGEHYVTVISPGFKFEQARYSAEAGAMAKVVLRPAAEGRVLLKLLKELAAGFSAGDPAGSASALARWTDVEEVLVASVARSGGGSVTVLAARVAHDGHVLAHGEKEVRLEDPSALGNLAGFAAQLFTRDRPRGPGGKPLGVTLDVSAPLARSTWGYLSLGAGGAIAGVGTILGLMARSGARSAKALPQRQQVDIESATGSARSKAAVADTMFLVSAVGVGVGIYLVMPQGDGGGIEVMDDEDDPFALSPVPLRDGGAVVLSGRF